MTLAATVASAVGLTWVARRWTPHGGRWVARVLGLVLAGVAGAWIVSVTTGETWKISTSLPLPLYDVDTLVPAAALWWEMPLLVELTWLWGLAGSPQSLLSPDVQARFPTAEF